MTDTEYCPAEWEGVNCELDPGHTGDHEVCIVWAQDVTPKPAADVEVSPGYALYLANRFGGK